MTDTGAKIKLDETEVHSVETVPSQNTNVFDNWMFFFADRTILTSDEQKARGNSEGCSIPLQFSVTARWNRH